ncbi:MAG: AI-2E family transporter [Candidatus Poseidoniales archaeon]|nr:AI-2E family transporter [Candidatus Poseidoniales archaeon]MEC8939091.1 AI-2E family transporter [Candidatus Thermoplasmatota archaeon]MEC8955446.1 AI-2E family transporter [Candidatus Thermoplasmatota archaeon]MEC9394166.1 AI-2E family transporter [Candidatus Thermoplasmatota archaeon]MEC9477925.1 AI-2E family transporter [Candidatus Thermoplasmatota archaeon]
MSASTNKTFRGVEVSTLSHIAILLLISILAIIHLKSIIQPLVVAILLFFLIRPPAQWLEDRYGHPLAAYGILTTGVVMVFLLGANILYQSLQDFSSEAGTLSEKMTEKIAWFSDLTVYGYSFDTSALTDLITVERINEITTDFVGTLAGFTGSAITIFIFLIFIIVEAETLPRRLEAAYPEEMDRFSSIVENAGAGINTYVITKASVAFGQAVIVALILSYMGIPGWFMWASITFLLDFVPYVGAPLSFIPPTIISFILFEPLTALLILAALFGNQVVWGQFVEPQLAGQRLDMSPIVLLILVAFWGWAWGIMGMILGVPLAVIMKLVLESDPRTRPIAMLLSLNPNSNDES